MTKERSPSFPFIPLAEAVKRLHAFEQKFGRHPAPPSKVGLAWGMKENSSQAFQTLAALKSFGFIRYEGGAGNRTAVLTDQGRTYLRAQQDSIKKELLRSAATHPAQIQKFWKAWGADRPPDEVCIDDLVLKHSFTDSAARNFLKVYDATIAFAGLADSDKIGDARNGEDDEEGLPPSVGIGDKIQCRVNGSDVFPVPATVLGFSEDGQWVFTDMSDAGAPIEGVTVIEAAESPAGEIPYAGEMPPPIPEHLRKVREKAREREAPAGMREEKSSLDEGELVLWWPEELSAESVADFEYWVNGIIRKAKRRAGIPVSEPRQSGEQKSD